MPVTGAQVTEVGALPACCSPDGAGVFLSPLPALLQVDDAGTAVGAGARAASFLA